MEELGNWIREAPCSGTHPNFTGKLNPDMGNFDTDSDVEGYPKKDYALYDCPPYSQGYANMCLRRSDGSPMPGFDLPSNIGLNLFTASFDNLDGAPQIVGEKWDSIEDCGSNLDELRRLHSERLESMLSIDVMVGHLFNTQDLFDVDNTLVIFTSDNGYLLGEHSLGNKGLPYEESIRVPLLIRAPGGRANTTDAHLVVNIDLAPTILDYAQLPWFDAGYGVDGRSLRALLEEDLDEEITWRKAFLAEAEHARNWIPPVKEATPGPEGDASWWIFPDYTAVRTAADEGNETYVDFEDSDWPGGYYEEILYDMDTDPLQIQNVLDLSQPSNERLAILQGLLLSLSECAGESCRSAETWW